MTLITPSARFERFDDCLSAAVHELCEELPELEGWALRARWGDESRETIVVSGLPDGVKAPHRWRAA
jgi:hypothetical protein